MGLPVRLLRHSSPQAGRGTRFAFCPRLSESAILKGSEREGEPMFGASTARAVAAVVTVAATGAAKEAGREAWTSLLELARRAVRRPPRTSDGDALPVDPQDPAQVRVLADLILEEAAQNDDFAAALESWTHVASARLGRASRVSGVHNEVAGNARVATVVQADAVNGISFGHSPLPADSDAQ
jgi:hypothetical protein